MLHGFKLSAKGPIARRVVRLKEKKICDAIYNIHVHVAFHRNKNRRELIKSTEPGDFLRLVREAYHDCCGDVRGIKRVRISSQPAGGKGGWRVVTKTNFSTHR